MDKLDRKIADLIEDNKSDYEAFLNQLLAEVSYREQERIAELKAKGFPKAIYKCGDEVAFRFDGKDVHGEIFIVDRYGTFEQNEEPSYDIMVDDYYDNGEKVLVKHIRQSSLLEEGK